MGRYEPGIMGSSAGENTALLDMVASCRNSGLRRSSRPTRRQAAPCCLYTRIRWRAYVEAARPAILMTNFDHRIRHMAHAGQSIYRQSSTTYQDLQPVHLISDAECRLSS